MSIVRVGTTKKYADGWEAIFGGKGKKPVQKKARGSSAKARKATARKKK